MGRRKRLSFPSHEKPTNLLEEKSLRFGPHSCPPLNSTRPYGAFHHALKVLLHIVCVRDVEFTSFGVCTTERAAVQLVGRGSESQPSLLLLGACKLWMRAAGTTWPSAAFGSSFAPVPFAPSTVRLKLGPQPFFRSEHIRLLLNSCCN